jgi:uncharacterized protein (DUF362 family)
MPKHQVSRRTFLGEALGACVATPGLLKTSSLAALSNQQFSPPRSQLPNPFTKEGKPIVVVVRGSDFPAMFEKGVELLGEFSRFGTYRSVIVKPNFVFDQRTRYPATTDEQSVLTVVRRLQAEGFGDITVADRRGNKANGRAGGKFEWSGLNDIAEAEDFKTDSLLDDSEAEAVQVRDERWTEMPSIGVIKTVYDADLIINMPTIKRHTQTNFTCALKNMMGVLDVPTTQLMHLWGEENKQRYDSMPRDEVWRRLCLTIAEAASAVRPEMTIVDARTVLTEHHVNVRTGGPKDANCLIMSGDSLAVDVQAAQLLKSVHAEFDLGNTATTFEYAARLDLGNSDPDAVVLKEAEV